TNIGPAHAPTAAAAPGPPPPAPLTPATASTKTASSAGRHLEQGRLVEINRQRFRVSIGNRTAPVGESCIKHRPARLKLPGFLDGNAAGNTVIDRQAGAGCDRNKKASPLGEFFQVGDAPPTHTPTNFIDPNPP